MSKYEPLRGFLRAQSRARIVMSFAEVERVLGFRLPASARDHQAWWANESSSHVQARAWMNAGYETAEVDLGAKRLVFKRLATGMKEDARMYEPERKKVARHPAFGAMKGTFTIEPGYDLTQPMYSDKEWNEIEQEMLTTFDKLFPGRIK